MVKATRSDFYVYALFRDDGRVFYIGKGHGQRWTDHERDARVGKCGYRNNLIREIQARGCFVPRLKIHTGLTEAVAHEYEVALIAAIGRHPNGPLVNLTDGGEGLTGYCPSAESRAKMSKAGLGRKHSPERIAKVSAANRGKKPSPQCILAIVATQTGRKHSPEHIAKVLATKRKRPLSVDALAKMSAASLGKKWSAEQTAKRIAKVLGKPRSPETKEKLRVANIGKEQSAEIRAKIAAGLRAYHARRPGE